MNPAEAIQRAWVGFRSRWVDPVRARWALRREAALLRRGPRPRVDEPSVLFFSMHRSGSTLMHRLLRERARDRNLTPINLERYCLLTGARLEDCRETGETGESVFCERGYYYGVLRGWHPVPDLDAYRVVLLLRDPRDMLTSHFFSLAFGHRMMTVEHLQKRQRARRLGLDRFVVSEAARWKEKYAAYFDHLLGQPNVHLVRYEDLIENFPTEMGRIMNHVGWPDPAERWNRLVEEGLFEVDGEDPGMHKRQVSSGDHRDKLAPETRRALNDVFGSCLERLDYEVEP